MVREPLANPDILDIIEVLSPTCSLELVTNGDYLNVELVQQLYSRGLHHLVISAYDGPHQIEKFNDILSQSSIDILIQFVTDGPLKMIMAC